jgi:hypothetical protein
MHRQRLGKVCQRSGTAMTLRVKDYLQQQPIPHFPTELPTLADTRDRTGTMGRTPRRSGAPQPEIRDLALR